MKLSVQISVVFSGVCDVEDLALFERFPFDIDMQRIADMKITPMMERARVRPVYRMFAKSEIRHSSTEPERCRECVFFREESSPQCLMGYFERIDKVDCGDPAYRNTMCERDWEEK